MKEMSSMKKFITVNKKTILIVVIFIMLLLGGIFINRNPKKAPPAGSSPQRIVATIAGEVKYPNSYALHPGATIRDLIYLASGLTEDADTSLVNLDKVVENAEQVYIGKKSTQEKTKVNLNLASVKELMTLPGIGEKTANNIFLYRKLNGPFITIPDLLKVKGVTEKVILNIIDEITLSEAD